jgi:hypothetical protein
MQADFELNDHLTQNLKSDLECIFPFSKKELRGLSLFDVVNPQTLELDEVHASDLKLKSEQKKDISGKLAVWKSFVCMGARPYDFRLSEWLDKSVELVMMRKIYIKEIANNPEFEFLTNTPIIGTRVPLQVDEMIKSYFENNNKIDISKVPKISDMIEMYLGIHADYSYPLIKKEIGDLLGYSYINIGLLIDGFYALINKLKPTAQNQDLFSNLTLKDELKKEKILGAAESIYSRAQLYLRRDNDVFDNTVDEFHYWDNFRVLHTLGIGINQSKKYLEEYSMLCKSGIVVNLDKLFERLSSLNRGIQSGDIGRTLNMREAALRVQLRVNNIDGRDKFILNQVAAGFTYEEISSALEESKNQISNVISKYLPMYGNESLRDSEELYESYTQILSEIKDIDQTKFINTIIPVYPGHITLEEFMINSKIYLHYYNGGKSLDELTVDFSEHIQTNGNPKYYIEEKLRQFRVFLQNYKQGQEPVWLSTNTNLDKLHQQKKSSKSIEI